MEEEPKEHKLGHTKSSTNISGLTLQKAIELGEYEPAFLAQFPEWYKLTRHIQFEYIRKAIENRNKQLMTQWAEITNILDFRLKPHLREALRNIEKQLQNLQEDKEKLFIEYSR
jgi:hypothetical protein